VGLSRWVNDNTDSISMSATRSDAALPSDLIGTSWTFGIDIPHGVMVRYT
jgi:hypothetical protein